MEKQFTRDHSLTAKGFAITLLLFYHLFETENLIVSMEVDYAPFSLSTFLLFTRFGNVCVSMFVFLTAFGIAAGLLAQGDDLSPASAYRQAVKRFVNLAVQFFVLYLSANLLWGHYFDYQSLYGVNKQGFLYLLTDAAGMSMFFDTPTLNATWWYMEIAYLLIFLIPFLTWLVKKIGYPVLLITGFLPFVIAFQPDIKRYLFVAVLGVCAAYGKWLDRLLNLKIHPFLQWGTGLIVFALCVLIRQNYIVQEYYLHLIDAPIALFLVYFASGLIGTIPVLGKVFRFIGRHSMNIYLIHTFFYLILWRDYIYYFKYAGVTFLLLLLSSLLYSILLEFLKKITKLHKLLARYRG